MKYPLTTFLVLPVRDSSVIEITDARGFYKVFYVTSGSSGISINDRFIMLDAGDILFLYPGDRFLFQVGKNSKAYLCLIHTEYLSTDSTYLLDLFTHFAFGIFHRSVIALDSRQSDIVRLCFETMIDENESENPDKKQATVLNLQMILLQIQRAGRKVRYGLTAFSYS